MIKKRKKDSFHPIALSKSKHFLTKTVQLIHLKSRESEVYISLFPIWIPVPEDINPSRLRKTCDRNPDGVRPRHSRVPAGFMRGRVIRTEPDNTVLLHLPAGVPLSFLIPRGTTDFVRSYRCRWFQVSWLKRRHNGAFALAAESVQVGPPRHLSL